MGIKLSLQDFVNSKTFNLLTGNRSTEKIVLPVLPPPDHLYEDGCFSDKLQVEPGYSEAQLQQYALEAVRKDRRTR